MQVKGWRIPNRELSDIPLGQVVGIAKERLASLEAAIERRYLKPPLGARYVYIYFIKTVQELLKQQTQSAKEVLICCTIDKPLNIPFL